jgi:DNA replication and repair protein RecF
MRLQWVELDRFRNLQRQKVPLHPRFNLLLGPNGQGKTNFLEAVGYLGTLRSFRTAGRNEMIRSGENMCRVSGEIVSGNLVKNLAFALDRKGRVQFVDDQKISSPEKYLQTVKAVHFIPEDVSLVGGSPSWRRKVVDRSVFEIVPDYVHEYRRYLAALRQRNALLRRGRVSAAEMNGWNKALADTGAVLVRRRWRLLLAVNPRMAELGQKLGLGKGLRLTYFPSFRTGPAGKESCVPGPPVDIERMMETGRGDTRDRLLESLARESEKEKKAGHSLIGPHRDHIQFHAGEPGRDVDLARYGSQGQKRSAVLAFKMSLAGVLAEFRGEWPLVILDDVASELDDQRRKALGDLVRGMQAQFFISTTGQEYMFLPAGEGKIWKVNGGLLEPAP